MSLVKSFSVGNGDMFYIRHNSSTFTTIDCNLVSDRKDEILNEISEMSQGRDKQFISTHPDKDHIYGLGEYIRQIFINRFYAVRNIVSNTNLTYYSLYYNLLRHWLKLQKTIREPLDIDVLWPYVPNSTFQQELENTNKGGGCNNISPIFRYEEGGGSFMWMGDMETDFMEKIKNEVKLPKTNVLFAPHHGRVSGRVIKEWLDQLQPDIIVVGEAPSKELDYYTGYHHLTQNTAGDILFDCERGGINIYVSNRNYTVDFPLRNSNPIKEYRGLSYIGTLTI